MRHILTPDDLRRGDLAEPGWHPMEVIDYNDKEAETDGSNNSIFQFKIIDGPNKGVIAQKLFNEKALGFGKALWTTFNFPKDANGNMELSSELFKKTIGFKLMGYIKRGKSNKGNEFNDIVDFRPMS
jgi:Protein of unknown function (DUF669)